MARPTAAAISRACAEVVETFSPSTMEMLVRAIADAPWSTDPTFDQPQPAKWLRVQHQDTEPRGTTHLVGWPVTSAIMSKSLS